jgi:hypothetical protein
MVDDRPEDAGPSEESVRPKRAGPTIDLEATEISGDTRNAAADAERNAAAGAEPDPTPRQPQAPAKLPVVAAAVAGAGTAAAVLAVAWFLGWNTASPLPAPPADTAVIDGLAARIASVESKTNAPPPAAAPVPDAAAAARIETLEKSSASLRAELAAARAQSEKLTALVDEMKLAPREAAPPPPDLSAINERLAQIERTTRAQGTEIAQENAKPADDMPLRRVVAASLLDAYARQGDPYAAVLAAAKSLSTDADALKPLDAFAASGVPNPVTLCRELLTLVPKLTPPAPENSSADAVGIVDRLKAGASQLVRIERTDALGHDRGAVIARVTAAALRNDSNEARRELNTLSPADRAAAQSWIDKADARDAALAASRQFAANAMTALAKPAL